MVTLDNAAVRAGQFQLQVQTMHLAPSQFHVVLGPTGSGKTLLLETIAGLHPLAQGQLRIDGVSANDLPPEARRLSYLPQDNALFPHLDVRENIAFGMKLRPQVYSSSQIQAKIEDIAHTLGIGDLLTRRIDKLSGGERQRVALARALVLDNELLLLDEPTSSLHESMQEDFFMLLKDLAEQFHLTVILATHHRDSAFLLADTLHFIWQGNLLLSATPATLFDRPLPRVVADYMGIDNLLALSPMGAGYWKAPALGMRFHFPALQVGGSEPIQVGIHPIDVRIVKPENIQSNVENTFEMRVVRIFHKLNDVLVILEHPVTRHRMKMQLGIYQFRKMDIEARGVITCKIQGVSLRQIDMA